MADVCLDGRFGIEPRYAGRLLANACSRGIDEMSAALLRGKIGDGWSVADFVLCRQGGGQIGRAQGALGADGVPEVLLGGV